MRRHKTVLIVAGLVIALQLFLGSVQTWLFGLLGERLSSNIIFSVMIAAALAAAVWSAIKGHRDLLSLMFVVGTLLFLLLSRPVFAGRFSLFLFFLLGVVSAFDEKRQARWLPILVIFGVALLCEWLPTLLTGGIRFYWLDAASMVLGGMAGRLVICSNH